LAGDDLNGVSDRIPVLDSGFRAQSSGGRDILLGLQCWNAEKLKWRRRDFRMTIEDFGCVIGKRKKETFYQIKNQQSEIICCQPKP
jgi:hypothetical protein